MKRVGESPPYDYTYTYAYWNDKEDEFIGFASANDLYDYNYSLIWMDNVDLNGDGIGVLDGIEIYGVGHDRIDNMKWAVVDKP
jgi:hypothetical protein